MEIKFPQPFHFRSLNSSPAFQNIRIRTIHGNINTAARIFVAKKLKRKKQLIIQSRTQASINIFY